MRRVETGLEILDGPARAAGRAASLAEVEGLKAWFGGDALTRRWVARALAGLPGGRPVRVLDVGAGGGALAVRLVEWGRRSRRAIRVLALDRDPDSARLARAAAAAYPEIAVVCGDASALPVRRGGAGLVVPGRTPPPPPPPSPARALGEIARPPRPGPAGDAP